MQVEQMENKDIKISFDFDGTLEFKEVQKYAKKLVDERYNVCILTTRYSDPTNYGWCKDYSVDVAHFHDDLYAAAKFCGITEINFTEYQFKPDYIDKYNIDIHLDDNYREEVIPINSKHEKGEIKAQAVLYKHYGICNWKSKIEDLINQIKTTV